MTKLTKEEKNKKHSEAKSFIDNIERPVDEILKDVKTSDDGFTTITGEMTPFHDFKENKVFQGVLVGAGKTIGEGKKAVETWLFENKDGEFLVPQWAMLNELNGVESRTMEYRLTHQGYGESKDGFKFTRLKVEQRPVEKGGDK